MKRYEFCYRDSLGHPMFSIMYDETLVSACERFLCRAMEPKDMNPTSSGNYIIQDVDQARWVSVKESDLEPSSTFSYDDGKAPPIPPTIVLNLGDINLGAPR